MIKYLGSKRTLIPRLLEVFGAGPKSPRVIVDLFSGTSRVGHACKKAGYRVLSNDHNSYAETLARCYVQADLDEHRDEAIRRIGLLMEVSPKAGYFTRTFCVESRFFTPENGARIDAMRDQIQAWSLAGELHVELEAILLVSLMEAADRVDSTTGVQMAYLKSWAPRAKNRVTLRLPDVVAAGPNGKCTAHCGDAVDAARMWANQADLVYLDPPYNQHKYVGNYHIWETLVRWDAPEAYGVARKRVDCRERGSAFNSKPRIAAALGDVIDAALSGQRVKRLVLSFSDEGYLSRADISAMLEPRGALELIEIDYKRYVGAQIGIHSPKGKRVGKPGARRNTEYLFVLQRP
ncbi:MAG: DNA adenine methylase [Planctomycetota bacterium]|nr:DNA adenine methylase [Planctomycetota bacterium]MDG2144044.1 DNA adenine methylase [Planctomycetota bacterium]